MSVVFRPPPGWPAPPPGWVPDENWRPDPAWPPAPADWQFWGTAEPEWAPTDLSYAPVATDLAMPQHRRRPSRWSTRVAWTAAAVTVGGALLGVGSALAPTRTGRPVASTLAPPPAAALVESAATVAPAPAATPVNAAAAKAALARLAVRSGSGATGYTRAAFGQAWADVDRNGCDTRNDVLRRDLTNVALVPGTRGCAVLSGTLKDPYGGSVVRYTRGGTVTVEVDHVVSLADAWASGAATWTASARTAFANDPAALRATTRALNQAKGDKTAARWLPPSAAFRCQFVALQVAVKAKYRLSVTAAEKAAMGRVLQNCTASTPSSTPTPARLVAPPASPTAAPPKPTTPKPTTPKPTTPKPTTTKPTTTKPTTTKPAPTTTEAEVYYRNCAAAWAAGAAPLHAGEPGYRSGLDGDKDGVACEDPP